MDEKVIVKEYVTVLLIDVYYTTENMYLYLRNLNVKKRRESKLQN